MKSYLTRSFSLFLLLLCSCSSQVVATREVAAAPSNAVLFMSDFGLLDDAVPICKGTMLEVNPTLRIVDVTHQITPFAIADAARYLANMTPYFPAGTVFVTVVDPGVGSERKLTVAKSKRGHYFVGPDNGLNTFVEDQDGIEEVREITNSEWIRKGKTSATFHGKDVFSPVGARIARGDDWTKVGPVLKTAVRLKVAPVSESGNGITGQVIATDGAYGNLITNVMTDQLKKLGYELGDPIKVRFGKKTVVVTLARVFDDVAVNKPLLYLDWHDRVCFAVNQGNFSNTYKVKPSTALFLPRKGKK